MLSREVFGGVAWTAQKVAARDWARAERSASATDPAVWPQIRAAVERAEVGEACTGVPASSVVVRRLGPSAWWVLVCIDPESELIIDSR